MTQKLVTIGEVLGAVTMIGAVIGGLALAALIMGLIPAIVDASAQTPTKIEWRNPLHSLGMDDVLTVERESKDVALSCEWPGIPLDWWGDDGVQTTVEPPITGGQCAVGTVP